MVPILALALLAGAQKSLNLSELIFSPVKWAQ